MPRRNRAILALLIALLIGTRTAPGAAMPPEGADDPWIPSPAPGQEAPKISRPESSGPTLQLGLVPEPESLKIPPPEPVSPPLFDSSQDQKTLKIARPEEPESNSLQDPSRFVRSSIPTVLTSPEHGVFPTDNVPLPPPRGFSCDGNDASTSNNLRGNWPTAWGVVGFRVFYNGERMAPNGVPFDPLFDLSGELYIGLLPNKKLYAFGLTDFWGQYSGTNITNSHQGQLDFSKREWDFTVGIAWNYCASLEFRVLGYAMNNLNRGTSPAYPYGYNDGVGLENRWYLPAANVDIYDIGRLSFLSIGYLPSNTLTGGDGQTFKPGLFARAYLTWDIPSIRSYLFLDGIYEAEQFIKARLLLYDTGLAVRPCLSLQNLEFRLGVSGVYDVEVHNDRALGYVGIAPAVLSGEPSPVRGRMVTHYPAPYGARPSPPFLPFYQQTRSHFATISCQYLRFAVFQQAFDSSCS